MSKIYQALQKLAENNGPKGPDILMGPRPFDHPSFANLSAFVQNERKCLLICGCEKRCGTTYIAYNLAQALATKGPTLLVDLSPGGDLARRFSAENKPGFWDYSEGGKGLFAFCENELLVMGKGMDAPKTGKEKILEALGQGKGIENDKREKFIVVDGGTAENLSFLGGPLGPGNLAAMVIDMGKTRKHSIFRGVDKLAFAGFSFAGLILNGE